MALAELHVPELEARQFRLLYGITSLALVGMDLDEVLRASLELVAKELAADAAEIWVVDPASELLRLQTLYGVDRSFHERDELRIGEGLPGQAVQMREVRFAPVLSSEPAFVRHSIVEAGFAAYGAVPMECMGAIPGVLCVATRDSASLSSSTVRALTQVASLFGLVLTTHELQEERRNALVKLDSLGARDVVHRALHDFVLQALFALGLELGSLRGTVPDERGVLSKAAEDLSMVVRDVRSLLLQLEQEPKTSRSPEGLRSRIEALIATRGAAPAWRFEYALPGVQVDPRLEVELYLIVRELVANVFAHARATSAYVQIGATADAIEVEVGDDGIGFDVTAVRDQAVGLAATRRRLEALGGSFRLESNPGHGSRFVGTFPLPVAP